MPIKGINLIFLLVVEAFYRKVFSAAHHFATYWLTADLLLANYFSSLKVPDEMEMGPGIGIVEIHEKTAIRNKAASDEWFRKII